MKSLKSRATAITDLPFIKMQGYILRDHILKIAKNNTELTDQLKNIFKGSGVTSAVAYVFYDCKSWAELKVHSSKSTTPNTDTVFANDSKNKEDLELYSSRLNEFINRQLGHDSGIIALGYAINLMPQNTTRTPKTTEMKKFICKMEAGSPMKMTRSFSVAYLNDGTEQRGMVVNLSDAHDGSEQFLRIATKNGQINVPLSDICSEQHSENIWDIFDGLDNTITGKEATNAYNKGSIIIAYTVITDDTSYNNKALKAFTIKPETGKTLNDLLRIIANTHTTNGFKFKL